MTKTAFCVLLGMTLFALLYNYFFTAHFDEIYYWDWSRHLALSYYDGPPLIAYSIKLSTLLFGNNTFSIKFVSVAYLSGMALLVHQFTKHLFDKKTAEIALVLTVFWPLIQGLYHASTPDSPLLFFWIATLYSFYLSLSTHKIRYFYLTGLCAGLLLLSKYNGVLLLFSLALYLIFSKHRQQFKNPHLYLAALLAFLIFSPVLIWNTEHDWISFAFQWGHGVATTKSFQVGLMGEFLGGQLALFNPVFAILLIVLLIQNRRVMKNNPKLTFLFYPFIFPFLFFFYNACFSRAEANWPAASYLSAIILLAYGIHRYHYKKIYQFGILLVVVLVSILKFMILFPHALNDHGMSDRWAGWREMMQDATPEYQKHPHALIISDFIYNAAEAAFYLPGQPHVYILDETQPSQYRYWNTPLKNIKIKEALYIGEEGRLPSSAVYFQECKKIKDLSYQVPHGILKSLSLFYCHNP